MKDANLDVNVSSTQSLNSTTNTSQELNVISDVAKQISVDFGGNGGINVSIQSPPYAEAEFGSIYVVEANNKILYASTDTWNSQPQYLSKRGYVYIYSDWKKDAVGRDLAGIKIGDGNAYLIDLPFLDDMYFAHIHDAIRHITPEEREFWNNKVRCYMDENGTQLIFTTN